MHCNARVDVTVAARSSFAVGEIALRNESAGAAGSVQGHAVVGAQKAEAALEQHAD